MLRNISPKQIEVYRNGSDLVFNDKNSNHTVSMKNWYISNRNRISTLEFDLGLNSIKIHKLDRDDSSDSDYLKSKVSYASLLSSNKIFLLDADVEHNLRCVISTSSINIPESYITLGFTSFQDQVSFFQNCDLKEFELTELKNRINIPEYKNKLLYDLELSSHEHKKIDYYKHLIHDQLFNNTDRIIQVMKDIHNPVKDFRFENGTYNITLSEVVYDTVIDFHPLFNQSCIKTFKTSKEGNNNMLVKLPYDIFNSSHVVILELADAYKNEWYKKLHIALNNCAYIISYNADIGMLSLASVTEDFYKNKKNITVTESGIEWKVGLTNEEMLLKSVRSKVGNSDVYQRSRREVYMENNQEQSLFSYKNNDHAQPMSSGASRLEFWPIKLVKNIGFKIVDAVKYLNINSFEKVIQSAPIPYYDILKLDTNTRSYLSDTGSNTELQYTHELPNNNYEHSTPPSSTENQEVNCVPYIWDANSQEYTTDAMSCILPYGHAKIFSNIHQGSNSIQEKGYSIKGDNYKNCRPVEFYGRPSAYCEGDHTNLVYTQNIPPSLDQINAQLMLARVFRIDKLIGKLVTRAKVLLGLEETHVAKEENTSLKPDIVEITSQQQNEWQISIKNIESLLKTLSSGVSDNNILWAKNIFEDRIEEIEKLSKQSAANTEIITALNENLKVLQTDLEESIECICDTGCQRQELQQADSRQYNSRYSAHAHLVHSMSALHVDNNIGYCSTTNLNHVIDQYPQIVSNYT